MLAACGGDGFKVIKDPKPDSEGFLSGEVLQASAEGLPSAATNLKPADRQAQSYRAAEIRARIRVVDFLLAELKTYSAQKYQNVVMRLNTQLALGRYDVRYSPELELGGQRADAHFELFAISGYVHTNAYNEATGRSRMLYRVVKANLLDHCKSGFGISSD
jgi:hypothetical protein